MLLIIAAVIALNAAVASIALLRAGRKSKVKADRWAEFEQQFRAYAARRTTHRGLGN